MLQFARSSLIVRAVLQGAAPAGRCQSAIRVYPKRPATLWFCGPLCRSQMPRPGRDPKLRSRKAARVGKESFRSWAWCAKKQLAIGPAISSWQLAIGLVFSFLASIKSFKNLSGGIAWRISAAQSSSHVGSREAAAEPIPHPSLSTPRLLGSGWHVVVRAEFQ